MKLALSLATLLAAVSLEAAAPVVLDSKVERVPLGLHMDVLEDAGGKLTINDVSAGRAAGGFRPSRDASPSYGFSHSAYWARFALEAREGAPREWIIELDYPLMDRIELYVPDGSGGFERRDAGYAYPFSQREIKHRNFLFSIEVPPDGPHVYYMRFRCEDRMEIPLALWPEDRFFEKNDTEQYILGAYFGIIAVMLLYNLFLYFSIKDRTYLHYVFYILSFGLMQFNQSGIIYQYVYPDALAPYNRIAPFFNLPLYISVILFTRSFLNMRALHPRFDRFLLAQLFLVALFPVAYVFMDYSASITVNLTMVSFGIASVFAAGLVSLKCGYRPARYFITAWCLVLASGIVYILKIFAVLPSNHLTANAMQIGSSLELILLSLGIGDRINMLTREKEETQQRALETQTRMAESFARFVPREFLGFLNRESIVDVGLGDQVMTDMTVLFTDIRSFTTLSEKFSPQETIDFLNDYLGRMSPVIRAHNGFIDKYIGDAIMALFPGRPEDAVDAALGMLRALEEFNAECRGAGLDVINIGVGIHTGMLMLGTVGERDRIETTVIADAVNTASRLEGMNKEYGSRVLISRDSWERIAERGRYRSRDIGQVSIRGRSETLHIMEILP